MIIEANDKEAAKVFVKWNKQNPYLSELINKANKDIHYVFKYELNRRYNGDYYKLTKDDIKIESFN